MVSVFFKATPDTESLLDEGIGAGTSFYKSPESAVQAMFRASARTLGLSMSDTLPKSSKITRSKALAEEVLYHRNVTVIQLHVDVQKAFENEVISTTSDNGLSLKYPLNLEFMKIGRGLSSVPVQVMAADMYLRVEEKDPDQSPEPERLFKFMAVSERAGKVLKRNFAFCKGTYPLDTISSGTFCLSDLEKAGVIEWVAAQGTQSCFDFAKLGVLA